MIDARNVLLKFFFALWLNQVLPAFDREDDLNVDLRIGVGHATKFEGPVSRGKQIVGSMAVNPSGASCL